MVMALGLGIGLGRGLGSKEADTDYANYTNYTNHTDDTGHATCPFDCTTTYGVQPSRMEVHLVCSLANCCAGEMRQR